MGALLILMLKRSYACNGKEPARNVGGLALVPVLERSPGEGRCNPLPLLAWRIPWTEEPDGLYSP